MFNKGSELTVKELTFSVSVDLGFLATENLLFSLLYH